MTTVHPSAVVADGAELDEEVEIGAYSVVGPGVKIGKGTEVKSHVNIDGLTTIGEECVIFPFASIGTQSQDLKYEGGKTFVEIGDRTTLREYVTVNSGTGDGDVTKVGSDCHIMAYCHVAHNCEVGDHVIMSNCAQLAGHVVVQDRAIIGGMAGVHQFVRIGTMSFVGGFSRIAQDVPPYMIVEGVPAAARGINSVGLKRSGVKPEVRSALKEAYRLLYREELSVRQAIARIKAELEMYPAVEDLVGFLETTQRGTV